MSPPASPTAPRFSFARIQIKNYRNFREVDCKLGSHVVLFGENAAGKSNLLRALRLVLDPDLPDSERRLETEDFWSGGTAFAGTEVVISVDFVGFEGDDSLLALLGDHVLPTSPKTTPTARLTYRYAPKDTIPAEKRATAKKEDYDFAIYGRDDPSDEVDRQLRRHIVLRVLGALRDAEGDLRMWRRSPLRPLIEFVEKHVDATKLHQVAKDIDTATNALVADHALTVLKEEVTGRLEKMIGAQQPLAPTLGFASTDPERLLQSIRLFSDNRLRQLSETSLGLANAIYVALILVYAEWQEEENEHAALLLAIEEPEAHLHPQLQRSLFRDLLSRTRPVIVSTHSPNIASITPLDALVLVTSDSKESKLVSLIDATLTAQQRQDLQRYLDVTRAEILFSRGVILVEGDAEKFIVPAAARLLPDNPNFDHLGISICSVAGTDFTPYVTLLQLLGIPWVVMTDGDEGVTPDGETPLGLTRARNLVEKLAQPAEVSALDALLKKEEWEPAEELLNARHIFVGVRTLEPGILAAGGGQRMAQAFTELSPGVRDATLAPFRFTGDITDEAEKDLVGLIERVGKGRFAQRLAEHLIASDVPSYISDAISAIVKAVARTAV
ncbi:MAG TPA: AAA family ATPase [Polyangiaceae bacterium]|nr:AAA family ATPase [Polyangiaceae bacterium]